MYFKSFAWENSISISSFMILKKYLWHWKFKANFREWAKFFPSPILQCFPVGRGNPSPILPLRQGIWTFFWPGGWEFRNRKLKMCNSWPGAKGLGWQLPNKKYLHSKHCWKTKSARGAMVKKSSKCFLLSRSILHKLFPAKKLMHDLKVPQKIYPMQPPLPPQPQWNCGPTLSSCFCGANFLETVRNG